MELLNGKFTVAVHNSNASLEGAWNGATQAKVFRIKFNETGKHCFVKMYGGSLARIDEKDALYCLLSESYDYHVFKDNIEDWLVNDLGYEEYIEDRYGLMKKNPKLKSIEKTLKAQYNKACTLMGGADKIADEFEAFCKEYDY